MGFGIVVEERLEDCGVCEASLLVCCGSLRWSRSVEIE